MRQEQAFLNRIHLTILNSSSDKRPSTQGDSHYNWMLKKHLNFAIEKNMNGYTDYNLRDEILLYGIVVTM